VYRGSFWQKRRRVYRAAQHRHTVHQQIQQAGCLLDDLDAACQRMGRDAFNAERACRPLAQWQAAHLFLNKCRGCTTFRQGRPGSLCHGSQAAGLLLSWKRRRGQHTCQRWTPAHTRVLLAPGPCWSSDLPKGSGLIYRGLTSLRGGLALLGCGVCPCHVAPFGLPIRWGQARSSVWLRDVAWVRCLHAP
jgi:hypothetical protein